MKSAGELVKVYEVDVASPEVSGIEQLDMLRLRDEIHAREAELGAETRAALAAADRLLAAQAALVMAELGRFVDLAEERREHGIAPERWWWYLDVVAALPGEAVAVGSGARAG